MADRSDYSKSRTNINELLPDSFNSEVNKSLIENTYNRFLTKDETVEVIGTIGEHDPAARVNRQIIEDTVHRQGYQLQPLVHHKIATVDYASSSQDILNELARLGVDIDRLPKWGDTQRFNYAPPVDLDKLVNYTDYYWYDANNVYTKPQYVVMKTKCAAYTSRLSQKEREIAGVGDNIDIFNVQMATNEIMLLNNVEAGFTTGMIFDIVGSLGIDGVYEVVTAEYRDGFTYIVPEPALPNSNYGGGQITFDTIIRQLTQDKNAICDGTSGWDSAPWDDNDNPTGADGVQFDDPMLLAYIRDNSQDVFSMIIELHPEYVDGSGNIVVTDAWPLWKWLDQPKPEFIHKWDWTGSSVNLTDWQNENKWIHKLDLPPGAIANSTRAVAPIIEYLGNLELNEWSYTAHSWLYRADPIRDAFEPSAVEPTYADYLDAEFHDKWVYVEAQNPVPINHQEENSAANLMSLDSTSLPYKLKPYLATKVLQVLSSTSFRIDKDYTIAIGDNILIHTLAGIQTKTVTNVVQNADDQTVHVLGAISGLLTAGDSILKDAGTRPFNAVLFDQMRWDMALAGQQNTRVYIDGREQIGNYAELLYQTGQGVFSNGVLMDAFVSQQSQFEVGIDPSAEADKNRGLWDVRTTEWLNDQDFRDAGRPTTVISPIRYRYHQQHKKVGETKFPLFDIYNPDGTTAYRANEIFTYVIDQNTAVETNIGLRVKKTNDGRTFHFNQLLIDYDNGPMYCYKDFDETDTNPSALFTIWRTSDTVRYVPRYVNEYRRADGEVYYNANGEKVTESVPYGSGDWEIPSQLYFNSSHENRVEISSVELLEHIKTILRNQTTLDGFKSNPQYGHRLLTTIDYGVGGTIHEHNDSWDLLTSALFSSSSSPIDVLDFASTAYESALSSQEDYILNNAYSALLNESIDYIGDFTKSLIDAAIEQYELNDNNNLLFGDTSAWFNDKGVRSWPSTAPVLGLTAVQAPNHVVDEKLDINEIKHHDGHYSWNRITQGDAVAIAKRVVRYKYKDTAANVDRYRGWTPTQAAVGTVKYGSFADIPVSKLKPIDYWLDGSVFKRFEVVAISPTPPSTLAPAGSLWLRVGDNQLMVRTNTTINPWVPLTIDGVEVPAGETIHAWKDIDLTAVLNELILEIETRLSDVTVEHAFSGLKFPETEFIKDQADSELHTKLLERAFLEFAVKRQIAFPYASVYMQTDPFSWNYKGVDANERDQLGRQINIWAPFVTGGDVNWKGTWQGTYFEVFGTYYPHLEPWVLQGYTNKPTWWDAEYADTTGTRRWTTTMWENVVANRIKAVYDAPTSDFTIETDPDTGTVFKVMDKKFNYVPVNTVRTIVNSNGGVIYGLDDLFPLYDARILEPANIDIANASSIGKPMIRRPEAVNNVNLKAAYEFGEYSPIELEWKKSTQYIYDLLKIAFLMQPMRFMHNTWGLKYLDVAGLNVNAETSKVFSHVDTIFHGDVVDGETYSIVGLNQWYVNYVRRSGIDFKVSNFRELWTEWTGKMGYQFGGFINTKSFSARTAAVDLIKEDYNLFSKKAPGYESKWIDSLNISVANYGQSRVRNGVRVPVGDGKDWTFTVSLPATTSRVVSYYGTRRYEFTVVDEAQGIMQVEDAIVPWNTGDQVYVDTSLYLPFPMDQVYSYYVIRIDGHNNQFKLSRSAGGAHRNEFVPLRTSGDGVQYIGEVQSTFYAYAGERTDAEWKHHTIDKSRIFELATPFTVLGVQGLIDVIDGYAAFKRDEGFVFNDSTSKEYDYNTARLLSWQTEIERAVHTIYTGLGRNNTSVRQYGNVYEISIQDVNEDPDTFIMVEGSSPFQYGDRVYLYTTGSMPGGVNMNTPYYVIPNAIDNTRFQLATTAQNAFAEIAINVTDVGVGRLMIGSFTANSVSLDDSVEINPFRNNLWISTPQGILSDVFTGGESYNASEVLIYDQYGRPLPKGSVMVFRNDKMAHVKVRGNMLNDVLIDNSEPTPYNLIHLGGIKVYVDGYEHVVIFNDYMTNGQLVYDAYIGMSLPRFNVEFERAENRNLRPNIGGYFLNNNDMIRNLEAQVNDMRNYYRTYDVSENADYVPYARALLGYEEPTYLDQLNTPQKSKFAFWKGMIQRKGSRNAVRSFINSEHFVDAKVDEFWAYKIADFGDARPRFKPKVRVLVDDAFNNDLRFEFTDVNNPGTDARFTQITLDDQTRWVDLPSVRQQLNGLNMAFDAKAVYFAVDATQLPVVTDAQGSARLLILDQKYWGLTFQYLSGITWTHVNFSSPNDRVVLLRNVDTVTNIQAYGYVPDVDKLDPIELLDQQSQTTVTRTKYWNPIVGKHYYIPMKNVDFMSENDPALYDSSDWTDNKLGWTWFDQKSVGYVPYNDEVVYPEFNDRIERWGRQAEWADAKLYEWVRSSVDPIVYVETEVGQPLKCWFKRNADFLYEEEDLSPIHSMYDHAGTFTELMSRDQRLEVSVYVNGAAVTSSEGLVVLGDVVSSPTSPVDQFGLKFSDYVTIILTPSQELIDDETYREDYKYIMINEQDTPVYYFWVANRTSKNPRHTTSVAETLNQLLKPQVPYHVFLKFFGSEPFSQVIGSNDQGQPIIKTIMLPARFTEVLIKDIAAQINADNRYVVQFTRFFNLRDDLDTGRSPLDLKNKHAEWYLFRREQANKIPSALWIKATESLMGYKLADFNAGVLTPVPSLERVIYDNSYGTTTRFGLEEGQTFVDRETGVASVQRLIESSDFDTSPVDKYVFLDQHSFDTPLNIKNAMDYIFVNFSSEAVNTIFFELLQDALASKRDYSGLLKTSFIALHGIKILETSGNVTE